MPKMRFPVKTDGLCASCRNGQVTRHDKGIVTFCNNLMTPLLVRQPVRQCTDYDDRRFESEHEMRAIAWTVTRDKQGQAGFRPPKKNNSD